MLLIGSSGRNAGKTRAATRIIRNNCENEELFGLKVTAVTEKNGLCPRGGEGCGVCSSLEGEYSIVEEKNPQSQKDTALLLQAGATRVFWLRVMRNRLREGIEALLKDLPDNAAIVAESNSLRLVVQPGLFLMVVNSGARAKPSAQEVLDFADLTIESDDQELDPIVDTIRLTGEGWECARMRSNRFSGQR
jgi:hypothetical protein